MSLEKLKGEWIYILSKKIEFFTKESFKIITLIAIGFIFITAIILIKYKPVYKVTISGEEVGYVNNKEEFEKRVQEEIIENNENECIAYVEMR